MTMYHFPWRIEELFQKWQNFIKNQLPCTCSNNFPSYHDFFFGKIWGRKRTYQVFLSRKRGENFPFFCKNNFVTPFNCLSNHISLTTIKPRAFNGAKNALPNYYCNTVVVLYAHTTRVVLSLTYDISLQAS